MKITEVMQPSDKTLLEAFSKDAVPESTPQEMLEVYRTVEGGTFKVITEEEFHELCFGSDD